MMLASPTFDDRTGHFPGQSLETEFFALNEGLRTLGEQLGRERYESLLVLSNRMRTHFEADQANVTEETLKGRAIIHEMEAMLAHVGI